MLFICCVSVAGAQLFVLGLDLTVQAPQAIIQRLFPRIDDLIALHHRFGLALRERQNKFTATDYFVERIADVLLSFVCFSSLCVLLFIYNIYNSFNTITS